MWDYEVLNGFRATGSGGYISAGFGITLDPSRGSPGCHCCAYVRVEDPSCGVGWPDQVERSLLASHCKDLRPSKSAPSPQCTDFEAAQDFGARACGLPSVFVLAGSRITVDPSQPSACPCCVPVTVTDPPGSLRPYSPWPANLPQKILFGGPTFVRPWGALSHPQPAPAPAPLTPYSNPLLAAVRAKALPAAPSPPPAPRAPSCECGSSAVGSPVHSRWCPLSRP